MFKKTSIGVARRYGNLSGALSLGVVPGTAKV